MKHSKVRQTIVETASELFYSQGYNLTGINEIIKEAGIAKATLYSHFSSKEDICLAYLEFKDDTFLSNLKNFLKEQSPGENRVLGLFDFLKVFFTDNDFNGCWCLNTISEIPKENKEIRAVIQNGKETLINYIEGLLAAIPELTEADQKVYAKQIYVLYEGGLSESHLHQEIWPIETARGLCEKLIA